MPSAAAVEVSIIATCCAVSFSYPLSGEPATIAGTIARTAPGEAASRLTVWEVFARQRERGAEVRPLGERNRPPDPRGGHPLDVAGDRVRIGRETDRRDWCRAARHCWRGRCQPP